MADEKDEEAPKKKGNKTLIMALVAFNLIAAGGVGYFVLSGSSDDEEVEEEGEEGEEGDGDEAAEPEVPLTDFGPLVEDKPLVGNLNDPGAGRYVKIKLHYEIKNEEMRPRLEAALVPIRSELLIYFTGLTVEDTIGTENKVKIVEDIKKIVDRVVGEGVVRRVFFTEFVTQ